jgi:hypothetical protein
MKNKPNNLDRLILLKGDYRKVGDLIELNAIGSTGTSQDLLFETNTNNIVYLDLVAGSDGNSGDQGSPVRSYAFAASLVTPPKTTIEIVDGTLTGSITQPTQTQIQTQIGSVESAFANMATGSPADIESSIFYSNNYLVVSNATANVSWSLTPDFSSFTNYTTGITGLKKIIEVSSGVLVFGDRSTQWSSDGQTWNGGDLTDVSSGNTYTNYDMSANGDTVILVQYKDDFDDIRIQRSTDGGRNWSIIGTFDAGATGVSDTVQEPVCTFDTDNDKFLVMFSITLFGSDRTIFYSFSTDATGATFDPFTTTGITNNNTDQYRLYGLTSNGSDIVAVGSIVGLSGENEYSVFSNDGGATWAESTLTPLNDDSRFMNVVYRSANQTFYAMQRSQRTVFTSVDGGANWTSAGNNYSNATGTRNGDGFTLSNDVFIFNSKSFAGLQISSDLAGFELLSSATTSGQKFYSNTCNGKVVFTGNADIQQCRLNAGLDIGTSTTDQNEFSLFNNLIIGNQNWYSTPIDPQQVSVNQNTMIGNFDIFNSGYTGTFQIRDNIIEGNMTAEDSFDILSGNLRGDIDNVSPLGNVSSDNPLFFDTVDYRLSYEVLGFDFDSPLTKASIFYDRPDGVARDYGCYNIDDSQITEQYLDAQYIRKPDQYQINQLHQFQLDQGKSGIFDGYNDNKMRAQEVILTWKALSGDELAFFERQELRTNPQTFLSLYPNLSIELTPVVLDGAASIGDIILNIDATAIYYGDILRINGKNYNVLYGLNVTNEKTLTDVVKIVLDRPLEVDLLDNTVIDRKYPKGQGNYIYDIPRNRNARKSLATGINGEFSQSITVRLVRDDGVNSQ